MELNKLNKSIPFNASDYAYRSRFLCEKMVVRFIEQASAATNGLLASSYEYRNKINSINLKKQQPVSTRLTQLTISGQINTDGGFVLRKRSIRQV